jgi:hypothetical protein
VEEGSMRIPISLQLVNKQLDIEGDGILGKDFLIKTRAQISYEQKRVDFKWQNSRFEKSLKGYKETANTNEEVRTITLKKRSETIVRVPVECENGQKEGLIEKREVGTGIYVASSLITAKNGYALTSILHTNDREVEIPEPRLRLAKIEGVTRDTGGIDQNKNIEERTC